MKESKNRVYIAMVNSGFDTHMGQASDRVKTDDITLWNILWLWQRAKRGHPYGVCE